MGCNQSRIDPNPPTMKAEEFMACKDAERLALLTDFATAMKEKMDAKDTKYRDQPYQIHSLVDHFNEEVNEFYIEYIAFKHKDVPLKSSLFNMEVECIDVANMAFFIREECIRLRMEMDQ